MKALGIMQAVAVLAWSFWAAAAGAFTITHNGVGTGGVVTDASGEVTVALIDVDYASSGAAIKAECDVFAAGHDACLEKDWMGGSENDTHELRLFPEVDTPIVGEWIANDTGLPWRGYWFEVTGADLIKAVYALYATAGDGSWAAIWNDTVDYPDGNVATIEVSGGGPTTGQRLAIGIFLTNAGGEVVIRQHPTLVPEPASASLVALVGVLLAVRRRRSRR